MSSVRRIQMRRDSDSDWQVADPTLRSGEIGLNETNGRVKMGDGSTAWNLLPYLEDNQLAAIRSDYGDEIAFAAGVTYGENI